MLRALDMNLLYSGRMVAREPAIIPAAISYNDHMAMFAAVQKKSSMAPSPEIYLNRMMEHMHPLGFVSIAKHKWHDFDLRSGKK